MDESSPTDAMDEIVEEVRGHFPDLAMTGLPITGRVMRLARYLEQRREEQLAEFGLTLPDFDMLATMRRKRAAVQPINVREFQRSLMLSSGGTTKRLDRLESAGLIERRPDPDDRRGVLIALTPAGEALIDVALPALLTTEAAFVEAAIPSDAARSEVEDGLRRLLVDQERR